MPHDILCNVRPITDEHEWFQIYLRTIHALSSFQESVWFVRKLSSHLLHSPQSHPSHQAYVSCLMKGSPLLHISSRVRQGDKGVCWSNTQTNRHWQKHTFVAQRLALISDSAKSQEREASLSLWTGAFQRRSLSLPFSLSLSLSLSPLWRSACMLLHSYHLQSSSTTDSAYIFSRTVKGWIQNRAEQSIHITDREHDKGDVDADYLRCPASSGLTEAYYSERTVQGLTAVSL